MKIKLLFLITFCTSIVIAQNIHLKKAEQLVNSKCIGSPTDRNIHQQTVIFKVFYSDSVEVATETHELASGVLLRKNKFHFKMTDIDSGNIVVKQFGNFYGVFLYTKEQKKSIRQSVLLAGDPLPSVYNQHMICISDFENKQVADELKAELIKAIGLQKR